MQVSCFGLQTQARVIPMPKKRDGLHNLHVKITEKNYRILQKYCYGGIEKLTASAIMDLLLQTYVEDHLSPRLACDQFAKWTDIHQDIPKVTTKVAHLIEPTAFKNPETKVDPERY